jgi:hypothetical protein
MLPVQSFLLAETDESKPPTSSSTSSRVCPGMHLADRMVFHIVTVIISLYRMEPLEGKTLPDPQSAAYTDKVIQYVPTIQARTISFIGPFIARLPIGFECRFILRDEKAENLLKAISLGE